LPHTHTPQIYTYTPMHITMRICDVAFGEITTNLFCPLNPESLSETVPYPLM
jgi:hypothetical protein